MIDYREHAAGTGGQGGQGADAAAQATQAGTIIMLHGFGANAADLYPLHQVVDPESRYRWIFPEAPYSSPMLGGGQAWFPRDEATIVTAITGAYFNDLSGLDPEGLRAAAAEVSELATALGVDWSRTILAGFSQGAMVSTECVAAGGIRPAGLGLFSGAVVAADRWAATVAQHAAGLPVFHSHGTNDPILGYSAGQELAELLTKAGADLHSVSFSGGHTIPEQAVAGFRELVDRVLSGAS